MKLNSQPTEKGSREVVVIPIADAVSDYRSLPNNFKLGQNYPNPFNPSTNFKLSIANCQLTTLKVYDVLGREVAILVNDVMQPGEYSVKWDARLTAGGQAEGVPSGVYFSKLQSGSFMQTRKVVLIK